MRDDKVYIKEKGKKEEEKSITKRNETDNNMIIFGDKKLVSHATEHTVTDMHAAIIS